MMITITTTTGTNILCLFQEIQWLYVQLREKERELESVRCQPDHEKDQEIQRLRAALQEKDRAQATRAVLCSSLAEEADQLRGQLGATVKVCQELLGRLETEKKGGVVEEVFQQQKAREVCNDMTMIMTLLIYLYVLWYRAGQYGRHLYHNNHNVGFFPLLICYISRYLLT